MIFKRENLRLNGFQLIWIVVDPDDKNWANYSDLSRRLVTLNGGLVRESSQNGLKLG